MNATPKNTNDSAAAYIERAREIDPETVVEIDGVEYVDDDMLEARRLHKGFRINVPGKCKGCNHKSPDVAATHEQALRWFNTRLPMEERTKGFLGYQVRALTEGLHRDCIPVYEEKQRIKAAQAKRRADRAALQAKKEAEAVVAKRVQTRKNSRKVKVTHVA